MIPGGILARTLRIIAYKNSSQSYIFTRAIYYSAPFSSASPGCHLDALEPESRKQTAVLPSWLVEGASDSGKDKEIAVVERSQPLRNIRPFSATRLSVFHADALRLASPSRKNEIVKHLWKLRSNSSYRKSQNYRLVISANVTRHMLLHTSCVFRNILTSRRDLVEWITSTQSFNQRYSRIQLVDRRLLQYCLRGTTVAKQQVDTLAESVIPQPTIPTNPRLVIALDNIRYPQNIGNIIRTAVALNVDGIIYLKGTADPFDWKVTQITGGLQFMLPYQKVDVKGLKRFCKNNKLTPVVAHLEGSAVEDIDISGGLCVILSNESDGPDPNILKFAKRVTLPMHPLVNSLNVSVAGAILVHQLQERLMNSYTTSDV